MKKLILLPVFTVISFSLWSQVKKAPAKTSATIVRAPFILKNLNDSASYAVGMSIAGFCKQHGIVKPNINLTCQSFTDIRDEKKFLLTETTAGDIVNKLLMQGKVADQPSAKSGDDAQGKMTTNDSVSYAIGLNHASFFKQQGITGLDTAIITKAAHDIFENKPLQFNDQVANKVMNKMIILIQEEKAKPVIIAGRDFLATNKNKPSIKVTKTGLQYHILLQGNGIKPLKADTFVCHYRGTLLDGTEFDASYNRGQPLRMGVSQVIRGWTEGLQLMAIGSKYKFYIPYELGYGPFDNPPIPGGSVLIFEVELLDVVKAKAVKKAVQPVKKKSSH